MQLTHQNTNFKKQTFPIILVCDNIHSPSNIGSIFRICDAYGIDKIIFCGKEFEFTKRMTKTSRATEKIVNYKHEESIENVLKGLKKLDYTIISLEVTKQSKSLQLYKFKEIEKVVLIVGDENYGVSENALKLSDDIIHIEMFGHNSSMNVAQAANTVLYEITKQLLNRNQPNN